jgi:hypothetical protein
MSRPSTAWECSDDTPFRSDAETAGAVLYLLQNEPLYRPKEATRELDEKTQAQRITCAVCLENLHYWSFPQTAITEHCDHGPTSERQVCKPCLEQGLKIQLSITGADSLSCPLCRVSLAAHEVQQWAPRRTFEAYAAMKTRAFLRGHPEFVSCARRGCNFGQLHADGERDPMVQCAACGHITCFNHKGTAWHWGKSCAEYDRANKPPSGCLQLHRGIWPFRSRAAVQDRRSMETVQKISKPCPRCQAATELESGCKHMTCACAARPELNC